MDKAKLIEDIKELEQQRNSAMLKADEEYYSPTSPNYKNNERYSWAVKTINEQCDKELSELLDCNKGLIEMLTAPVPDGKECEECAAKQNRIDELNNELEMTVDELKNYRDELKECRNELRDSHRY